MQTFIFQAMIFLSKQKHKQAIAQAVDDKQKHKQAIAQAVDDKW